MRVRTPSDIPKVSWQIGNAADCLSVPRGFDSLRHRQDKATWASEVIASVWSTEESGSIPGGRTKLIAEPQVNRRAPVGCNERRTFTNHFKGRRFWFVQRSDPDWSLEMGVDQKIKKRLPGYAGLQFRQYGLVRCGLSLIGKAPECDSGRYGSACPLGIKFHRSPQTSLMLR